MLNTDTGSLHCIRTLNLPLQIADTIIHVLYDLLNSTAVVLMTRFIELVPDFPKEKLSKQKILKIVENPDNYVNVEFFSSNHV